MKRIANYVLIAALAVVLATPIGAAPAADSGAGRVAGWWSSWAGWAVDLIQRDIPAAGAPASAAARDSDCGPQIDTASQCATTNTGEGEENSGDRGPEIEPDG